MRSCSGGERPVRGPPAVRQALGFSTQHAEMDRSLDIAARRPVSALWRGLQQTRTLDREDRGEQG
jgi:hypothetical protein